MLDLWLWGIVAGVLQAAGYFFYVRGAKKKEIEPEPVTWFMFAYGTALLTVLEWDNAATWPELILPVVCAVTSLYVSYLCWQEVRKSNPKRWLPYDAWPEARSDQVSYVGDLALTAGYVLVWAALFMDLIEPGLKETAVLVFLVGSNLTTVTSFGPIIRSTYLAPRKERALPWVIWTLAYVVLGYVTYATHGWYTVLMLYPAMNAVFHGLVAVLALPGRRNRHGVGEEGVSQSTPTIPTA